MKRKPSVRVRKLSSKAVCTFCFHMDPIGFFFRIIRYLRNPHVFFYGFQLRRDFDLILLPCKRHPVAVLRISGQIVHDLFSFFMVDHHLMRDLLNFPVRSHQHRRRQYRVHIIAPSVSAFKIVLPLNLEGIVSLGLVFLIDPPHLDRILQCRVNPADRPGTILLRRNKKERISIGGNSRIQNNPQNVSLSLNGIDPAEGPVGIFLIPGKKFPEHILHRHRIADFEKDLVYRGAVNRFLRRTSRVRRHSILVRLPFAHASAVNRRVRKRILPSSCNRHSIAIF